MKKAILYTVLMFGMHLAVAQLIQVEYCMTRSKSHKFKMASSATMSQQLLNEMNDYLKSGDTTCYIHHLEHYKGKSKYAFSHIDRPDDSRSTYSSLVYYKDLDRKLCIMTSAAMESNSQIEELLPLCSEWEICNSDTRRILGHETIKANHNTKNITAWFAPDIPVADGPEKYSALPGLILAMEFPDAKKNIRAKSIEIKNESIDIRIPQGEHKLSLKTYIQNVKSARF